MNSTLPLRLKRRAFNAFPAHGRLPLRVWWMRATKTLEPEVREMTRVCDPGGTALDIGANHGVYSYFMVRHFDRVVAFEPQPACGETLRAWAGDRVELRPIALSDRDGTGVLSVPVVDGVAMTGYARLGDAASPGNLTMDVPVERLDDQGLSGVSFLKIDVEGHELPVLRGGDELLARDRPVLLVEIEQRHLGDQTRVSDVVGHLTSRGYRCFFRLGGSWVEFDQFRPQAHQDEAAVGTRRYVSMFLFMPDGRDPSPRRRA
jgi:FkbM family methyltransferase